MWLFFNNSFEQFPTTSLEDFSSIKYEGVGDGCNETLNSLTRSLISRELNWISMKYAKQYVSQFTGNRSAIGTVCRMCYVNSSASLSALTRIVHLSVCLSVCLSKVLWASCCAGKPAGLSFFPRPVHRLVGRARARAYRMPGHLRYARCTEARFLNILGMS